MNITEFNTAMAARKNAMAFHSRHRIKSVNDFQAHRMKWSDLNELEKDVAKEARAMLDKAQNAEGEAAVSLESAHDAFMALYDALSAEKDIRTEVGSRDPRDEAIHPAIIARRPGVEPGEVRVGGFDDVPTDAVCALAPEQRFTTWAQERSNGEAENLRGMTAGRFLRAMVVNDKTEAERRALAEASDAAGGYTVPDILSADLIDRARAASVVVRAGARTVPLTSDKNTIAKVLTDPMPAWRQEAGAVANSDSTFGAVVLTPRSLAVSVDISAELMADSLNLGRALPNILAAAMAVELDRVALIGSGTAPEPRGVANTSGIGTFAQDGLITGSGYNNLSKARTGILTANRGPVTAYIMHPRDEGTFVDLKDGDGQPLMAPAAIASIPVLTTTSIPVDGGSGSDESTIIAGNFAHLLIGMRSGIQIELFKGPKYISNLQYTMVAHMRADIAVEDPGAFYTLTGVGQAA